MAGRMKKYGERPNPHMAVSIRRDDGDYVYSERNGMFGCRMDATTIEHLLHMWRSTDQQQTLSEFLAQILNDTYVSWARHEKDV